MLDLGNNLLLYYLLANTHLPAQLMFDPMKSVTQKFPEWLAKNKSQLSESDYTRYGQQYQFFQRIVAVYETEPDNFPRLMELMQDIQEFGQVRGASAPASAMRSDKKGDRNKYDLLLSDTQQCG